MWLPTLCNYKMMQIYVSNGICSLATSTAPEAGLEMVDRSHAGGPSKAVSQLWKVDFLQAAHICAPSYTLDGAEDVPLSTWLLPEMFLRICLWSNHMKLLVPNIQAWRGTTDSSKINVTRKIKGPASTFKFPLILSYFYSKPFVTLRDSKFQRIN